MKGKPAGPKGSLIAGNLSDFGRDPLGFLESCQEQYGDLVPLRFFMLPALLVADHELIEQIFTTRSRDVRKTMGYRTPFMCRLFGQGLLTSEGELWTRQRKLAQPAFHRDRIQAYARIIHQFTSDLCKEWETGGVRPVHADMLQLTTRVVTMSLFSADVPPEVKEMSERSAAVMERFSGQFSGWRVLRNLLPSQNKRQFEDAMARLDSYIYKLIAERRRSSEDRGDLISLLLRARDEDGRGMDDRQLRDELVTLMVAGLDTTALAVSWALYLLALHPQQQETAAEELRALLQGRDPGFEDLPRLERIQWIVKESMRLYPPGWLIGRETLQEIPWKGGVIRKKTSLLISQWLLHRDPRHFPEPEKFRPERWRTESAIPKGAYFPFGGGPRICIGHAFATMEAVLVIAMLLTRFRVSCNPDYLVKPWPSITLQPRGGIHLQVQRRL